MLRAMREMYSMFSRYLAIGPNVISENDNNHFVECLAYLKLDYLKVQSAHGSVKGLIEEPIHIHTRTVKKLENLEYETIELSKCFFITSNIEKTSNG